MMKSRVWIAALLALALTLTRFSGVADGFQPANDNWQQAISLNNPDGVQDAIGTNVNATVQASEPNLTAPTTGRTVWWRFVPTEDVMSSLDTFGSNFDTVLHLYRFNPVGNTGFNTLVLIASNDQAGGSDQSRITFTPVVGELYFVRVGGFMSASGTIRLNFEPQRPVNDNWANAIALDLRTTPGISATNVIATVEALEQDLSNVGATVWWNFQAPADGLVTIDTFGSDFDTVLHVYTDAENGFGSFTLVAENDDAGNGTFQSEVSFPAVMGQWYEIRVGGFRSASGMGASGAISLNLDPPPPVNDNWASAIAIDLTTTTSISATNVSATVEALEQDLSNVGATVWWNYQAPADGLVTIDTFGSDFDTVLHVYTDAENGFGSFTLVAENDDASFGILQSQVSFPVVAGQWYEVRVGGFSIASGAISLNLDPPPPVNDNWASALAIDLTTTTGISATNVNATVEAMEQNLASVGATVWWNFQAPADGLVTIDTFGSDFDTVLHVYTDAENGFGSFTLVAENDDAGTGTLQSQVSFPVVAGQWYEIRVGGYFGEEGLMQLNTSFEVNFVLGDANGDGMLDNADIAAFVLALLDPVAYAAAFPDMDVDMVLDFSGNGSFGNEDIAGFLAALGL